MKKCFLVLFALLNISSFCQAQTGKHLKENGKNLFPAEESGNYGYINPKGDVVLPPVYQQAHYFYSGLAAVKQSGKYGFIDWRGNWIVKPIYDSVFDFSEGFAAVAAKGNDSILTWGYVDSVGDVLETLFPALCRVTSFHEGFAVIAECADVPLNYHIINTSGKIAFKPDNYFLDEQTYPEFHQGFMRVNLADNSKTFIDTAGHLWNKGTFQDLGDFSEGMAWFNENGSYGFINREGKVVIPAGFEFATDFSEGIAKVITDREVDPVTFQLTNGLSGYIDTKGKYIVKPQYEDGGNFSNGLACVKQKGLYGFINASGTLVINFQYTQANGFFRGMAYVKDDKHWQFINTTGTKIW